MEQRYTELPNSLPEVQDFVRKNMVPSSGVTVTVGKVLFNAFTWGAIALFAATAFKKK